VLDPEQTRWSTSSRTIHGPCRIYDLIFSPGHTGDRTAALSLRRGADTVLRFGFHERGGIRWCACPGSEIHVVAGQSVFLDVTGIDDVLSSTLYERPDQDGLYSDQRAALIAERAAKQNRHWQRNERGYLPAERLPL
jgi:hypothetical protein